jgi:hypothetical protein
VTSRFQIVEATWPLILLRFPRVVDGESVSGLIDAFDRALERESRFVSVLDGTEIARLPGPEERQRLVSWMSDESRQERERKLSVAAAVVVPSGLVRAFVAAIYFVRKPIAPQKWTETVSEGVDWACAQLHGAGIALTPEIDKLRGELGLTKR